MREVRVAEEAKSGRMGGRFELLKGPKAERWGGSSCSRGQKGEDDWSSVRGREQKEGDGWEASCARDRETNHGDGRERSGLPKKANAARWGGVRFAGEAAKPARCWARLELRKRVKARREDGEEEFEFRKREKLGS